jgi:hypothetical protein
MKVLIDECAPKALKVALAASFAEYRRARMIYEAKSPGRKRS